MTDKKKRLKKTLSLLDVYAISTGAMFSSGFFLLPGLATAQAGPAAVVAYLLAGLLILPAMLSMAELSTAMPRAGGAYYFIDRSLGPLAGTIGGLGTWMALILKSAFALVGMGAYLVFFFDVPIKPLAVALTVAFTVLNIVGAKETSGLQRLFVAVLLGVLTFFTVQGLFEVWSLGGDNLERQFTPFLPFGMDGLFGTVGLVFVSYAGLTKVASVAEEVENPDRNLPLGMALSLLTATVLYVVGVFIMIAVLDPNELRSDLTPVATAAASFFDWLPAPYGLLMIVIAAIAAFASTGNAGILSASRYPLAMARDRLVSPRLARVGRTGTPLAAILLTSGLMVTVIITLDVEGIAKLASAFQLLLFVFLNVAVIVMRESHIPSYVPGYRSPLYPWVQIAGVVSSVFLIAEMGLLAITFTLVTVLVGLGWYFYYVQNNVEVERKGAIFHLFARLGQKRYQELGEELHGILKEKGPLDEESFEQLVAHAAIYDLEDELTFKEAVQLASEHLAEALPYTSEQLATGFLAGSRYGSTPVSHGAALPHQRVNGASHSHLVLMRCRAGLRVHFGAPEGMHDPEGPVHAIFFLVSPEESPGQHLRALTNLAIRVDEDGFLEQWKDARSGQELKEALLSHDRFLSLAVGPKTKAASLVGKALRDLDFPEGTLVALIRRDGNITVPSGSTVLEPGDRITIVGDTENIQQLHETYHE